MKNTNILPDEREDIVNEKIKLIQKKQGLTFGTDAYLLASYIKPHKRGTAAEFGCGTGIISLLLQSKERFSHIDAFEIQEDFANLAIRNVAANGMDNLISVHHADVCDVSVFNRGQQYDAVFANPPYMKTNSGKRNIDDGKNIARHEVHGGIYEFCDSAGRILKTGGRLYLVWRPDRLNELVLAMCGAGIYPKLMTFVHADVNAEPSMLLVTGKRGGAPETKVTAPLILHTSGSSPGKRELSSRAAQIYLTMDFYSK